MKDKLIWVRYERLQSQSLMTTDSRISKPIDIESLNFLHDVMLRSAERYHAELAKYLRNSRQMEDKE